MLRETDPYSDFSSAAEASLEELLGEQAKTYPCTPAIASYRNKVMRRQYHITEGRQLADEVGKGFAEFDKLLPTLPQKHATNVAFIREKPGHTSDDYQADFWQLLSDLRALDPVPWPEGLPTDINDPQFQYCLFGKPYFPVGFWQGHPHPSRSTNSPVGMMIAFSSPDNVLPYKDEVDNAGGKGRFHKLVSTIRERDKAYSGQRLEVAQFFGPDGTQADFSQIWEYQGIGPTEDFPHVPLDLHIPTSHNLGRTALNFRG